MTTEIQAALGKPATATQVTHILRGSDGQNSRALIRDKRPPHVGALSWLPYQTAREMVDRVLDPDGSVRSARRG